MITESDLQSAGFRRSTAACNGKPGAIALWQLRVSRDRTVLYFVNIWVWDFSSHGLPAAVQDRYRYSAEVRFYTDNDSFDLDLHIEPKHNVPYVLEKYATAYSVLNCIPDPHNQP